MSQHAKAVLKSKLAVYTAYFYEAKKAKDLKRMALIGPIINELQDELSLIDE